MEEQKRLQDEKVAMLLLLEKYIKNGEKEKAAILGQKIRELNEEIEGAKTKKLTPENKK